MKFINTLAAAILSTASVHPATAALAIGDPAPDFSVRGAQAGTIIDVDLSDLLEKGPVVVYFFPSAFSSPGQSREFAENMDSFSAAGVSVVGISRDSLDALARYSTEVCDGKFPVLSADEALVNAYDVNDGAMFNTRTTYVVAPSGQIVFVYDNDDTRGHVKRALEFIQAMDSSERISDYPVYSRNFPDSCKWQS